MRVKAEEFRTNPARAYRAADKGGTVEIEHNHYKDRVFKLTAEDKPDYSFVSNAKDLLDNKEVPTEDRAVK